MIVLAIISLNVFFDSWMYNGRTFAIYNFVEFNVTKDMGAIYGGHHPFWYLTEGVTVTCATLIPLVLIEVYYVVRNARGVSSPSDRIIRLLTIATCFYVFGLSYVSHKEHRFLIPLQWY